jgi:hypothetical protein
VASKSAGVPARRTTHQAVWKLQGEVAVGIVVDERASRIGVVLLKLSLGVVRHLAAYAAQVLTSVVVGCWVRFANDWIDHLLLVVSSRRQLFAIAEASSLTVVVRWVPLAAPHGDVRVIATFVGVSGRHLLLKRRVEAVNNVNADLLLLLNLLVFCC